MMPSEVSAARDAIRRAELYRDGGRLLSATGMLTCSMGAAVGDQCAVLRPNGERLLAEVIGFSDRVTHLMPYDVADSLRPGLPVVRLGPLATIPVGPSLLGRAIDALGRPVDGLGPLGDLQPWPLDRPPPPAMERARIREPFVTGQRAIDGLLTCGRGQRIGIFAGSGVGKSTLLGEIARGAESDVNVIALIGERGREVAPFLEDCLGPEGLKRSIVVIATCEQSPLMRVRAARAAVALADFHRARGTHVLLMIDSLTRLAMAQREIGLLLGEPPTARGYTPSVFRLLGDTVERLGNARSGGITALLTVLVDGDDLEEPIADAIRSLVDGHIVLDRRIAERGTYPAIDLARSVSRLALDVTDAEHATAARKIRAALATFADVRDLIRIGAYVRGTSDAIDRAIDLMPGVEAFLRQSIGEHSPFAPTRETLLALAKHWLG